jgi:hypothetical protein
MKIRLIVAAILGLTASAVSWAMPTASAETIEVTYDNGGRLNEYAARWASYRRNGTHVRIAGPCYSECTVLLGQIPRERICVTPGASFGFHLADLPATTAALWKAYPTDIKAWISQHGGLTDEFLLLQSSDLQRFFSTCGEAHSSFSAVKQLFPGAPSWASSPETIHGE